MSLSSPAKLGKYEVRGQIGRGEMGTVYEGWDPQIDRRVAIKTVRLSESGDSEAAEAHSRFKREAQAAGRLTHPNIVGIYDYGETGDLAYIVMEYVEGDSLKAILGRDERLPVNETVRLMEELLAGLQFSHDRGVVHRDIKPANVMITKEGRVKIADFGIARIESSSMTQAGTVMGTPAYMSPEQFMGQPVDKRTDIYSTGVLLYQLLTGERPFDGSVSGIMHKALNTTPPRPSEVSVTASPAFDAVVAKAMSRRPDDRYPSASAFATDLRRAFDAGAAPRVASGAEDATIVGTAQGLRSEVGRPSARRTPVPIVAAAAVAVLVIVGGAAWFLTRPSGPAPKVVVAERSPPAPSVTAPTPPLSPAPAPVSQPATPPPAPAADTAATAVPGAAHSTGAVEAPPPAGSGVAPQAAASPPAPPPAPAERVEPLVAAPAGQAASAQAQSAGINSSASAGATVAPPPAQAPEPAAPISPPVPPKVASAPPPLAPQVASRPPITPPPSPAPSSGTQSAAVTAPPPAPVSPPAPVAAPPPPPKIAMVVPNLVSVSRALAQLAATSNCSLVQFGVTDSGEAVVSGLVGAGAPESTLRSAVHDAAPKGMTWQARAVNSAYCSALDTLRPIYQGASSLSVMLVDGKDRLRDGEAIRPVITMPDFPADLQVDYLSHDGSVAHLFPLGGAPYKLLARDAKLFIGQGKEGVGTVGAPYGTDMIIAIASSVPLFPAGAPKDDSDTVERYLPKLQAAIAAAKQKGARVVGNAFALETVER